MSVTLLSIILILAGYLSGSIPTAYLAGRWLRGRDLRQYGSGTVSGSMVFEHIAHWAVVPVGLFDVAKAALPAWLALHFNLGLGVAAACGIAAAIGHNWPVFLHFTGGRGLSTFLGLMLVIFPWGIPWLLVPLAVGYFIFKDSPPFALLSMLTLPILAVYLDGPVIVLWVTLLMLIIMIIKRLEANGRPLPLERTKRWQVLTRRLILDRDICSHQQWINRHPESEK